MFTALFQLSLSGCTDPHTSGQWELRDFLNLSWACSQSCTYGWFLAFQEYVVAFHNFLVFPCFVPTIHQATAKFKTKACKSFGTQPLGKAFSLGKPEWGHIKTVFLHRDSEITSRQIRQQQLLGQEALKNLMFFSALSSSWNTCCFILSWLLLSLRTGDGTRAWKSHKTHCNY